ncbi:MAG: aminoglycoside 6-N-acetyltransferase [Solirubrobacteraceae bacterium]|nr:aminoglycoside 6-N-acetyltransferase [Solirubrobacteraceae bacterium]
MPIVICVQPTLHTHRLTLRPLEDHDADALVAIIDRPGVREWWGTENTCENLLEDQPAFAIDVDGELAGWLGYWEEEDGDYHHASMDIFLAPEFQGGGLGPAALRLVARWLVDERGHHRLTIDPDVRNERAIRAYEAIGFRRVGIMRRYSRGPDWEWHDGLLMDLLAEELT